MKIQRYIGYDCESVNGFNNGYHYDDEAIECKDESQAFDLCLQALQSRYHFELNEILEDENGVTLITGYFDKDGNDLSKDQIKELDGEDYNYTYVFCNYTEFGNE